MTVVTKLPCIDSHQHYWNPHRHSYFWMTPGSQLDRVFAPKDLMPSLNHNGVTGTVVVQAAPTLEETDDLLALATREPSILGVVGWIDFEDRSHLAALERFKRNPKFKGVRPMIQDIADAKWVLHPNLTWAFEALVDLDLCFDALLHPQHIQPFQKRLSRHPRLRAVVDHAAKPLVREGLLDGWAVDIGRLARDTTCSVKLSGLTTEAKPDWTQADLVPYASFVLDSFGPDRVLFGSDWPVCLRATSYDRWFDTVTNLTASLTDEGRAAVFGGNAVRFYGLTPPATPAG